MVYFQKCLYTCPTQKNKNLFNKTARNLEDGLDENSETTAFADRMVLVHVDQHNNSLQQVFGIVKLLVGLLNDLVVQGIQNLESLEASCWA